MRSRDHTMARTAPGLPKTRDSLVRPATAVPGQPWPPKYQVQREKLNEIPKPCFERLLTAMDSDLDEKVSLEELETFVRKSQLTAITSETVKEMFREITSRRSVVHKSQLNVPFGLDELMMCCNVHCGGHLVDKGRYAWDKGQTKYVPRYPPHYKEWQDLLYTVNPKIYAAPSPEVPAKRIVAQYEMSHTYQPTIFTRSYGQVTLPHLSLVVPLRG